MKKYIITLCLVVGLGTTIVGCRDYLDSDYIFDERMSIEQVFQSKDYTNEWLARGYTYLKHDYLQQVNSKKNTSFNFADDMYYGDLNYVDWKSGNYTEKGLGTGNSLYIWQPAYQGIRHLSVFLNNIDMNKEFSEPEIADMKGQAHFLRAYCYWMLIRSFGPVPILPDEGIDYTKEYDEIAYPRNSYDECVDYISNELVKAAMLLEEARGPQDIVRPTRGAALSLRSRVLLYAASPLFNGKAPAEVIAALVDKSGKKLLSDTYDERKWAIAAAAAKDVIELGKYQLYVAYKSEGGSSLSDPATITPPDDEGTFHSNPWPKGWQNIDPFKSYRALFDGEVSAYGNSEIIFTRGTNQGAENIKVMVIHQLPRSQGGGYNCHGMTQKQCDAYYMKDGKDIPGKDIEIGRGDGSSQRVTGFVTASDVSKGLYKPLEENVSLQYANREPRFYASVAYNGVTWWLTNATQSSDRGPYRSWYYRGETEGMSNSLNWLQTGIGLMKYVRPTDTNDDKNINGEFSHISKKADPLIRYADILLMYAEALNELDGSYQIETWDNSGTHSISRDVDELKKGVQPVRIRAGIPDFTPEEYGNKELFRKKIKRERQIELMAEGQRYFDLRRWKDAKDEESLPMYGCNVFMTKGERDLFYKPVPVSDVLTCFAEKTYFWPIDRSELEKNVRLTQNPGWQSEK